MDETRTLARFVATTEFAKLPPEVVQHAKHLLLDHFAVALFSSSTEWGRIALRYAQGFSCIGEATVYGQPWKTGAQHAALANGLCAHGYEMDDSYEGGYCHPGAPIIPAALATAERENRSGRDFLLGVVAGYDVMCRISAALGREATKHYHPTGQTGPFGAAAAAASVMRLDEAAATNALGIAGGMSSGLLEFANDPRGTMVKRLYGGWPSQSGVVAAWFAREGLTGPSTIVEGRLGFLRGITPDYKLDGITDRLGEDFHILRTVFKPYAACRAFHPLIEAMIELKNDHAVEPDDLEALDVGARESIISYQMQYEPESIMAAQYSMPFTAALALYRDLEDPRSVDESALRDARVLATARLIRGHLDPEIIAFPRYAARIDARLRDGRTVSIKRFDHKGTPARPFTFDEIIARFHKITAGVIPVRAADRIIEAVAGLGDTHADALKRLIRALSLQAS